MMKQTSQRSGRIVLTNSNYKCFIPNPLPPTPPILIDDEMQALLSSADRKLGRLDGITEILPNPELFLAMYVQKEALLSSQIEGTQASLADVLGVEAARDEAKSNDVADVVNYVEAMNYGLDRLKDLPLSLRLIREIHGKLLEGVRGSNKNPGEFRTSQNWIGPAGSSLSTAVFVPPEPAAMLDALHQLELYFYDTSAIPSLIKIAMIHAQFESIHPFLDGNGRIGRLLITFWLCQQEILSKPLLYLSYYFKQHRQEYYDLLMRVRLEGAWEPWIKFFLRGIAEVSDEAVKTAKAIMQLKTKCSALISEKKINNTNAQRALDQLFMNPIASIKLFANKLKLSQPTASHLINELVEHGILQDLRPDMQRKKVYLFNEYYELLNNGIE